MESIITLILINVIPIILIKREIKKDINLKKSIIISSIIAILIGIFAVLRLPNDFKLLNVIIATSLSILLNTLVLNNKVESKTALKSMIVLVLFFIINFIQLIPIIIFKLDINNLTELSKTLLSAFTDVVYAVIVILIYRKELIENFKRFKENFNENFEMSFKYWFVGLTIMVISNLIIGLCLKQATAGNEITVQSSIKSFPIITLICGGLLAPISEELTFRKTFKDLFKNKWLFIILSSLVFSLLHIVFTYTSIYDFIFIIPYFAVAFAFALMDYKQDNIWPSITMHTIHNFILILLSIFFK